jgi:hypothetical protein
MATLAGNKHLDCFAVVHNSLVQAVDGRFLYELWVEPVG